VEESEQLLGLLTPLAKSWPSQWCLAANDLAIQVLGGAGYTRDHDVEQHYRDNRLNPIHEGTHGIQALDLLGRKVLLDGGAGLRRLLGRVRATAGRGEVVGADGSAYAGKLRAAADRLVEVTGTLAGLPDPRARLADATVYLEATGHVVVGWLWLEQWLAAAGRDGPFYDGKRAAARYFFTRELPKVDSMLDLLEGADGLTLELDRRCSDATPTGAQSPPPASPLAKSSKRGATTMVRTVHRRPSRRTPCRPLVRPGPGRHRPCEPGSAGSTRTRCGPSTPSTR
jgi:alkylation response protein AidB-like acyl-CoA dehydrogenase